MSQSSDYEKLEYAVNILIDRFLPGKWKIRQESATTAIVQPTGLIKKPRTRRAYEKFSESGLLVHSVSLSSPVHLVVSDLGVAQAIAADPERPAARPHWLERRAA